VETPAEAPRDEDAAVAAAEAEEEAGPAEAPAEAEAPAASAPPAEQDGPVEVTPEELAADLATRLWEVNQDLSLAVDAWDELPDEGRRMILEQTRYAAELYQFLARGRRR
jgi:hypothetical protein